MKLPDANESSVGAAITEIHCDWYFVPNQPEGEGDASERADVWKGIHEVQTVLDESENHGLNTCVWGPSRI